MYACMHVSILARTYALTAARNCGLRYSLPGTKLRMKSATTIAGCCGREREGKKASFLRTATANPAAPRRAATRIPVDRIRTKARAGRGDRPGGHSRRRLRPPPSHRTTGAVPWRRRSGTVGSPICSRMARTSTASVIKAMIHISAPHCGQVRGNAS